MDTVRGNNRTFEEYDARVEWSRAAEADAVKIFLPGFKREEIRVLVDNHGHLRTRAERLVAGNTWSRFQKDFQLPANCNIDGIRAKFDNETLTITLPKKSPSPQVPTVPASTLPQPEPRRPATAPPQKLPQVLPEPAKPSPQPRAPATTPEPPTLPPAPSQKPERRPSLPRKPPAPEPALPSMPEPGSELLHDNRYNGHAATTKPEPAALLKPKEEEVKEAKKPLPPATAEVEEEKKRMEREARQKMIEEKKKKANEEEEGMMKMAQQRRPFSANRGLLVNVAVAVVVLVGITAYLWHTLRNATAGGDHGHGEPGAGSYSDEM